MGLPSQPDLANKLTVIVPTFNRSNFIKRLLHYSNVVDFPFHTVIADSSVPAHAEQNRSGIESQQGRLNVEWKHYDCGLLDKLSKAVSEVDSPYCCFWADDDFQLPSGLFSCLFHLEQNPDCASCMGQFVSMRHAEPKGEFYLETYPSRDEESAVERVMQWSRNFYTNFYAVYRTPVLREMLQVAVNASCYERCRIIPEVLMGQMSLLMGRQKMLPTPSIVYQMHPGNDSRITPCVRDHTAFPGDYQRYLKSMVPVVIRQTGLSDPNAERLVDRSFRNVYRWTGGSFWWLKKAIENLRRPWHRMQLRFDALRKTPRFTRVIKERIPPSDPRIGSAELATALQIVAAHPQGMD